MSDWLYNAGIVGLINALKFSKDKVEIYNQYIEIDSSVLDNFEDKYFNYLADKYLIFTPWYKIVDFQKRIELIRNQECYTDDDINALNKHIDYIKDRVINHKSYAKVCKNIENIKIIGFDLLAASKSLKKISLKKNQSIEDIEDDINLQLSKIEEIIEFVSREEVKKHLIGKDLIYDVIKHFWNNKAFLNSSNSDKDIYEEFNKCFIQGALKYVYTDKSKAKYSCYSCDRELLTTSDAFDLTWLNKTGVDGGKKASHFWDFNRDDFICPICTLVYSCVPLGFTYLKGNGLFINDNADINSLLTVNKYVLKTQDRIEELEHQSYLNISNRFSQYNIENIDYTLSNIQIVKLDTSKQFDSYTFNILSKDMVHFLVKNSKILNCLLNKKILWYTDASNIKHYIYLYKEVIDRMYKNENLFSLIDFALNKVVRGEHNSLIEIDMLLSLNNNFIRGGDNMNQHIDSKKIYKIKCLGNTLKSSYDNRKASNKLNGISYRLLNAVKVKDVNKFLDTIINAYAYIGTEIPTVFINCLDDAETFQTVGYAFILGLMGEISDNTKNINKGDVSTNE